MQYLRAAIIGLLMLPPLAFGASATTTQENALLGQENTKIESSAGAEAWVASYSAGTAKFLHPAFLTIDSVRAVAGGLLGEAITWGKTQVGANTNPGVVIDVAHTKGTSPQGLLTTAMFIAGMVALYVCSILKWWVASANIFYITVVLWLLFAVWKVFSHFRRPRY